MNKLKTAVLGATGYTGLELIKILLNHPQVDLFFLGANSNHGSTLKSLVSNRSIKKNIRVRRNLEILNIKNVDLIFSCLPHGELPKHLRKFKKLNSKIIDLGGDYRLNKKMNALWYKNKRSEESYKEFQYLIPEINGDKINSKKNISNPGCYATSIILGLAPINTMINNSQSIIVDTKSGTTGAGRSSKVEHSFSETDENLSTYKVGVHQHAPEIEQFIKKIFKKRVKILMVPHLLPIKRGIMSNIYIKNSSILHEEKIYKEFKKFYSNSKFVRLLKGSMPSLQNVQNTNICEIGIKILPDKKTLLITSVIDNLIKGAAGQAVQNMNIAYGFDSNLGL
ncbi:MAG: N-acetyl-gamma-glutamyl-phosphate reductase [Thermodesulfobacteriota bacteirum]|nr:N-acetyl-gamma-glutamyl-phosphate reductase [Thermodesulfobacteriota bacterium]